MKPLEIVSLGAGVQSTAMLLMAEAGEFGDRPDYAIFADTGWEPPSVYEHLDKLERRCHTPIYRIKAHGPTTNIRNDHLNPDKSPNGRMPLYVAPKPGSTRQSAPLVRQCTREYKLDPIRRLTRLMLQEHGYGTGKNGTTLPPGSARAWIGISRDEAGRMSDSRVGYITNRYPLIEIGMSRNDCVQWLKRHGFDMPIAKSGCVGCPLHGDYFWRDMKHNRPEEWADAVAFDEALRTEASGLQRGIKNGTPVFLHQSLLPLAKVDLSTPEDHGQGDLFGEDCSGMCGV